MVLKNLLDTVLNHMMLTTEQVPISVEKEHPHCSS